MTKPLFVNGFGGGVSLEGSTETQAVAEMMACDSMDIGTKGHLTVTSDAEDIINIQETNSTASIQPYGVIYQQIYDNLMVIGQGIAPAGSRYHYQDAPLYLGPGSSGVPGVVLGALVPPTTGAIITGAAFPYTFGAVQVSPLFFNIGARLGTTPKSTAGLYVRDTNFGVNPISSFDALGTGPNGPSFPTGNKGKQLYFRGIVGYNQHLFGWGFDSHDATNGDGPNRLMFSNAGVPYSWGNDNIAPINNRDFTDSDAIIIGENNEIITAAFPYAGRLYIGTDRGMHYVAGTGRDTFLTDGATGIRRSESVIGPHALAEGPDGLLYGMSPAGLWMAEIQLNGSMAITKLYPKLRNHWGRSPGYWDLLWYDRNSAAGYPGKTNYDLVWMMADAPRQQLWIVIPYCNASQGYGKGTDTVIIKYHVRTGGFTRQVMSGIAYVHGVNIRPSPTNENLSYMLMKGGTGDGPPTTLRRYGYQSTLSSTPAMQPRTAPSGTLGPWTPFGPSGDGVVRRIYLVLSWDTAANVTDFALFLTLTVDDQSFFGSSPPTPIILNVKGSGAPAGPNEGDYWLDLTQTDPNLGNNSASGDIIAAQDWVFKQYRLGAWQLVTGAGGQKGQRVTLPIAFGRPTRGTRVGLQWSQFSNGGSVRYVIEGWGQEPHLDEPSMP